MPNITGVKKQNVITLAVNFQQPTRAPELVPTTGDTSFHPPKNPKDPEILQKCTEIKMAMGYLISLNFSHLKTTPCDVWNPGYVTVTWYMAFQKLLVVTSRQSLTNLDPVWWWIFRKTVVRNVEPTPTHQPTPTTRQGAGKERPTNGTSTPGAGDVKKFLHVHINTEHMKTCVYKKTTTVTHHLLYIFLGLPVYLTKILQKNVFFHIWGSFRS